MEIRPVIQADYEQWCPLWAAYNEFYGRSGATALPKDIIQQTWARFFDQDEAMYALVASDADGRLVGFAHYLFHRNTIKIERTCYMQDLYADPEFRGNGIGRKLIETIYDAAKRVGVKNVYWHTHDSNEIARGLYDGLADHTGFVVYRKSLS